MQNQSSFQGENWTNFCQRLFEYTLLAHSDSSHEKSKWLPPNSFTGALQGRFILSEINNELDERHERRDKRPKEHQVDESPSPISSIKFVCSKPAKAECQNAKSCFINRAVSMS